jgi:hypothetical protein
MNVDLHEWLNEYDITSHVREILPLTILCLFRNKNRNIVQYTYTEGDIAPSWLDIDPKYRRGRPLPVENFTFLDHYGFGVVYDKNAATVHFKRFPTIILRLKKDNLFYVQGTEVVKVSHVHVHDEPGIIPIVKGLTLHGNVKSGETRQYFFAM